MFLCLGNFFIILIRLIGYICFEIWFWFVLGFWVIVIFFVKFWIVSFNFFWKNLLIKGLLKIIIYGFFVVDKIDRIIINNERMDIIEILWNYVSVGIWIVLYFLKCFFLKIKEVKYFVVLWYLFLKWFWKCESFIFEEWYF